MDDGARRPESLKDFAEIVKFARTLKGFSGSRAGLYGGSYGGYVVMESLADFPDVFTCGVSVAGISNFATFLEKTAPWRRALRETEYGSLENDRSFLDSISPLNGVDRIRAPLLLVQGANDPRVPRSEAEQMLSALVKKTPETKMLIYEDEGHGLNKLKNRLDAYPKIADFLLKNLAVKPPNEPQP
jgi:dipeptidyl aminopeptidase/acylaminoacyl peptidase